MISAGSDLRSAFGELSVVDNTPVEIAGYHYPRTFWNVQVHHSLVLADTDDPNRFFGKAVTDPDTILNADLPARVEAARASVGPLKWDETYTFVPALALGGSLDASKVERTKAREQLVVLSQLAPIRRT